MIQTQLLSLLSNLGAIDQDRAIEEKDITASWISDDEKHLVSAEIENLVTLGYVERKETRIYLSKKGLIRAMSNHS